MCDRTEFTTPVIVDWHLTSLKACSWLVMWQIVALILSVAIISPNLLSNSMSGSQVWHQVTAVTGLISDTWKKAIGTRQTGWKCCLKTSREQQLGGCWPPVQVCIRFNWVNLCTYQSQIETLVCAANKFNSSYSFVWNLHWNSRNLLITVL